ncbi:Aquaporin Z [Labilithrix luteola]|uniref:Aquaporin Z n=1 Tax=Labilithrix luteola TaxID=1391654 RepID=A0A0K1PWS9_9BACT|nr:aquaporin Z [Labilithrix luteola]AKU97972.1 Aquaporin Z [Labilithrix luteola]
MPTIPMPKRFVAELMGTMWLVLGGCGTAVLAAKFPETGVGFLGVAFAFGLTVLTMVAAIGGTSGAHLNPAVTIGLATAGKFAWRDVLPYIVAQLLGAIIGAGILYLIASGTAGFSLANGFATNGFGVHSPGHYSAAACFLSEVVLTFAFLMVIIGATRDTAPKAAAPLAIGLALTLIHLISIPVTNTSVNPARSTGPALFAGGSALVQLPMFWIAPILGAVVAGMLARWLFAGESTEPIREQQAIGRRPIVTGA